MAETVIEEIFTRDFVDKIVILPGVAEVASSLQRFQWQDYFMFSVMLLVCIIVGLYFGFYHVSANAQEYLMGNRKMQVFPISMSLIASFISGISILGVPTETYLYGIQYVYVFIAIFASSFLMIYLFLPVFYELQLTSTYEYFEKRFDKKVRLFGSILFTIGMLTWLPIVIYVPALAFNQGIFFLITVIGVNIHYITPILCLICIFYTSLGGIKAVVWTDLIQALIMFGAMILVAIKGTMDIGGLGVVIERNWQSNRIELPNLEFNLVARYTFWALTVGGTINYVQIAAVNQNMVQRYLALPSLADAKKAVWIFAVGFTLIVFVCSYCGILLFATYYKCDPLSTKLVKEKDQLLPLLVMEVFGDYPGLPGIFVAGLLSASLSSLSTGLNAMAAVILQDFYQTFCNHPLTDKQSSLLMKLTVVIFGIICVALVYVIEKLGAVLQISMSVGAIASGPSLGMFSMGVLLPWVTAEGALIGGITSLTFMGWICFKAQEAIVSGELLFTEKPLTTEGCHYHFVPPPSTTKMLHFNASDPVSKLNENPFMMHHISYFYYTLLGSTICIVVGLLVSFLRKPLDPRDVDLSLLSPCVRRFIKPREYPNEPSDGIIYAYEANNGTNIYTINIPMKNKQQS